MLKSLSLFFVLLGPVAAYGDPIDSTLILFAQFGDARMTSAATLVDVEERWAVGAYHFTRASRDPVALLPIRDTEDQLVTEPEQYWQRLNQRQVLEVRPCWLSKADDLVLLELPKLPESARAIPLASRSSQAKSMHSLIGHPMSQGTCFERSKAALVSVSPMKWNWTEQRIDSRILQLEGDAPFPSGFSGGPVLNGDDELAGTIVASPDLRGNAVYATDASAIRTFLSRVYVLESWKALAAGEAKLARRRSDKAVSLEPNSLPTLASRWLMNRLEQ